MRASKEPMSIAELAERFGVHLNTVRFHLEALARSGRVERVEATPTGRAGPGRPPLLFRAADGMDPAGPRSYQLLAAILALGMSDGPDGVARLTAAGQAWGASLIEADATAGAAEASQTSADPAETTAAHRSPRRRTGHSAADCRAGRRRFRSGTGAAGGSGADRLAALPVPGVGGDLAAVDVPGPPRADAGCAGGPGRVGRYRTSRPLRRARPVCGRTLPLR